MVITNCYSKYMKTTTPFGAALRHYRKKEPHLTQAKFSKKIGISQAMISKIEKGIDDGSSSTREIITNYFGVLYDDFLEAGRQELTPTTSNLTASDIKQLVAGEMSKYNRPVGTNDIENHTLTKHQKVVETFPKDQQSEALEVNQKLVAISKLDPEYLEELNDTLSAKLKRLRKTIQVKDQGSKRKA